MQYFWASFIWLISVGISLYLGYTRGFSVGFGAGIRSVLRVLINKGITSPAQILEKLDG
jgi:hypothetical protein